MGKLTIRARLVILSSALLLVLVGTTGYLTRTLADEAAAMAKAADRLGIIDRANSARIAFGELRYWNTDLAVSQLTLSEQKATAARVRMTADLDRLAAQTPERIAKMRGELAEYDQFAEKAIEAYTNDQRVIGNSLLAQARQHSVIIDESLGSIVRELTAAAIEARDRVVAEAGAATRNAYEICLLALLVGAIMTFLVLRSISVPLRALGAAMNGLIAGQVAVEIPPAGRDEIGAMARILALFRDTLNALRDTLGRLEALREVGRTVGSTVDLEAVLAIIAARAVEFSRAGLGLIYEYDEATRSFRLWTSYGADDALKEQLAGEHVRLGEGAIGRAGAPRAPAQVADIADAPADAPPLWRILVAAGYRSVLAAPLVHEQAILGGLVVARPEPGNFATELVEMVEAFANQSALAVRNATLFAAQARRERELRAAHEELKAAQVNLVHAEKMASLGQLTAGIAHEIKNPLNFVNNFAGLSVELLDEVREVTAPAVAALDAGQRADIDEAIGLLTGNLEKIAEHGRRADSIVKSMLLHSRGGSAERQTADVNALIEEALNLAYHGARAQNSEFNITPETDLDPGIAPIELVPQEITRVFLNLFGNGFYAVNKRLAQARDPRFRPVLRVTTRDLAGEVEIKIRDNGVGVPPEYRDKLFTPFFTTKPTGEGTGLGLSISYDIVVQQHGGTITLDSRVNEFTEFTIRLPRNRQAASTGAAI